MVHTSLILQLFLDNMVTFPPSPDWSDCDSLADIDDLDAFLDAQGELSHFPTPPFGSKSYAVADDDESDIDEDEPVDRKPSYGYERSTLTSTDFHIAKLFTREATIGVAWDGIDVRMIERMLVRAQLPPEILALAFNILRGLDCHLLPLGSFDSAPNDLVVIAAISLAVSYTNDHPPTVKYWSKYVCDGAWTSYRIDRTVLQVFAALDWRLHDYSEPAAIQSTLSILIHPSQAKAKNIQDPLSMRLHDFSVSEGAKAAVEGSSACWANGQITPDGTPPSSRFVGSVLRLL